MRRPAQILTVAGAITVGMVWGVLTFRSCNSWAKAVAMQLGVGVLSVIISRLRILNDPKLDTLAQDPLYAYIIVAVLVLGAAQVNKCGGRCAMFRAVFDDP